VITFLEGRIGPKKKRLEYENWKNLRRSYFGNTPEDTYAGNDA